MSGESECVQESLVALRAGVRIVLAMLLDLVLFQLKFSSEFLVALGAVMRERIKMIRSEVSVHVALVGELLMAVWLLATNRSDFRFHLVRELLVPIQVRFVGIYFRAAFKIAQKFFLKIKLCSINL